VAPTKRPRVFSCIQVRKNPKMRPCSPSLACVLIAASISSNHTTAGEIDSRRGQARAKGLSACPGRPKEVPDMSKRSSGTSEHEARRDRLDAEALAASGDAHHQDTLRHDLRADRVAHLEQLATLEQPLLHDLEAADLLDAGRAGEVLDETDAVDQLPLLLEQG